MVDEFQDTNRLQVRLIESIRGPGTKLMVVGDALQSIYGFRHADLDAFREQRERVTEDPAGALVELTGNFRSRPEVIGAVNALGAKLIGEPDYRPLTVGAVPEGPPPAGGGPAVELLLTARKGWEELDLQPAIDSGTQPHHVAESRFVAERLRDLADAGTPRGEMVVLLRAFTHLDAYEDSLARAGLRPYVVGGRGYWSQQQVSDVCALLGVIANPLDDQSLFGALASPACGVSPDTLWLLRAAAGGGRHIWPALERAAGLGEGELDAAQRLTEIPDQELALLRRFAETVDDLRARGTRLPLAELIDRAIGATGYDLAVLLKPAGEGRLANVRKLMRIAEEFESREGRDLRGLLDFLAFREEAADESAAATAAEDHDGVRIMSVHRAKGLEFGVVAVPHLDRNLLSGGWAPLLTFGHGEDRRVGMQLRRLGARALNVYDHEELRDEDSERDAAEGLRLFHVAATRARKRLILSGVVKEKPAEVRPSTSIVERIVGAFEVDRERDSTIAVPAPEPRPDLDASFEPSEIAVRVSRPSPERAEQLLARQPSPAPARSEAGGRAPILARRPRAVPRRPLSYSAISHYESCGYRFQLERVFGFGREIAVAGPDGEPVGPSAREERTARGRVVHSLLEWSQANEWSPPPDELLAGHAAAEGLDGSEETREGLRAAIAGWLDSALLRERVSAESTRVRAELPLLLSVDDSILRGSIDLLAEREGEPPLVVDYKTDRLAGASPAEHAGAYEIQRSIYALAVAEARRAERVEVAYVFLERPDEPQIASLGAAELEAARARLAEVVARIGSGEFPVAPPERRSGNLCRGCPALGRVCSGPR
jgi:ATP-dependent exoDNAse (exonuclease V) beta subunit